MIFVQNCLNFTSKLSDLPNKSQIFVYHKIYGLEKVLIFFKTPKN